jgi:hypothetical protein
MAENIETPDLPKIIKTPSLPTKGQLGMKEALGLSEPFMQEKARLLPKITEAKGAVEEAKQAQKVTGLAGEEQAVKQFATEEKSAQDAYQAKIEKEPLPAFIPSKENAKDIAGLFSMVSVMGALLGGTGKLNSMQALNAMNGMLEGHQKGRADLYKKQATEFDKAFKGMLQKHSEFRKEMEDAIRLAATNKEAGVAAARLAAAKAGSPVVKKMLDQDRLVDAYNLVDQSQTLAENAFKAEAKLRSEAEKEAAAERRHREDKEAAERRHREDIKFQREKFEFEKKKAEAKLTKGKGGLGAKSFLESSLGVSAPDEKTSQKIVDTALGISQLGHVINIFKDPEVKTGVLSKLSSVNQKLTSLGDNNHEISDDELKQIINGEISPSAKNAVAQKEALFAAYTAEREIAGGRLLVSVVKQAGGALDPTNYEKAGFLNLLGGRREELVKRLRGARMSDDQINKVVQDIQGDAKDSRNFSNVAQPSASSDSPLNQAEKEELAALKAKHGR